jgi:hypothetical protein
VEDRAVVVAAGVVLSIARGNLGWIFDARCYVDLAGHFEWGATGGVLTIEE